MERRSSSVKQKLRKGMWSPEEDEKLYNHITRFGVGCWSSVPKIAGLERCGKSCRLRWINYLRPDLKRGVFSKEEESLIINLHEALGNRWAQIAAQLPGRTDNEIKNSWNSSLKKKLIKQGIDPNTHKPISDQTKVIKDERDCAESVPLHILQPKGLPNLVTSARMEKRAYDPLFLPEFDSSIDHHGYHTNFLSHHHQGQMEIGDPIITSYGSMPDLMNFDQEKVVEMDYSDSSASRLSAYLMNDVRESSSNCSSLRRIQTNDDIIIENDSTFCWDVEGKLYSMFHFQSNGIQTELQDQNSGDFSDYPY